MKIYTDGSTRPTNPGPGGYAVVICDDEENVLSTYTHYEDYTTNNRMELKAILYTMLFYGKEEPIVYSDSAYSINIFTNWMFGWARNGWVKSDGNPPENLDIIQAFYDLYQKGYRIDLRKIKGHSGNKGNELADKLATARKE